MGSSVGVKTHQYQASFKELVLYCIVWDSIKCTPRMLCYTRCMQKHPWLRRRIVLSKPSAQRALLLVVIYFTLAVSLVAMVAQDSNWARWHISYLGEGDRFSAHLFNALMMTGGALMACFSALLYRQLRRLSPRYASRFILAGFLAISLCVYLIGLFPRSVGVLPHDIFGHAIYFLFLLLCLSAPWTLRGMKRWFYIGSCLLHVAILVLFVLYWTGVSESLYVAEVATFVLFIGWTSLLLGRKGRR